MAAVRPPVDAELVLDADDVDLVDVEEVGGELIVAHAAVADLEAHLVGVAIAFRPVGHGHGEAIAPRSLGRDRAQEVSRERRDAAPTRHVIPDDRDGARCLAERLGQTHDSHLLPRARRRSRLGKNRPRHFLISYRARRPRTSRRPLLGGDVGNPSPQRTQSSQRRRRA